MLADSHNRSPSCGSLSADLYAPAHSIRRIVNFVVDQLPAWRDHRDRRPARSEVTLNAQLCVHLNGAARRAGLDTLQFCAETPDESCRGRSVDLAALPCGAALWVEGRRYSEFEVILPIECKRLPTPTDDGRDEREYVLTGHATTGGIQRYKLGVHGAANTIALIIAYVQRGVPAHWMTIINRWIDEASNTDVSWRDERLVASSARPAEGVYEFHSIHKRSVATSPTVELHHAWVLFDERDEAAPEPQQLSFPEPVAVLPPRPRGRRPRARR